MANLSKASNAQVLFACYLLMRQARQLLRMNRTLHLMQHDPGTEPWVDHVVIPCFEESATAPDTATFFQRHHPSVRVTFLVAAAESGQSTAVALREARAEVVTISGDDHSKAALINAFARLTEAPFALYDADSTPTSLPIRPSSEVEVVQQLSHYHHNKNADGFWGGVALNQTRWSFSFEANNARRRHGWYLVGHGLAIYPELLRRQPFLSGIHGEDLELGYRLSYCGGQIRVDVSGIDHAEVPTSVEELIEQSSRWFIGEVSALRQVVGRYGFKSHLLMRICGLGFWLLGPPCLVAVVAASLRYRRWVALVALSLAAGVELASFRRLNKWLEAEGLSPARKLSSLVGYWVKPALFSLGGFRAITRYHLGYSSRGPKKARQDSHLEG